MTGEILQSPWELARRQHGVVARRQLVALGMTRHAIAHRLARGRLHRVWPGVYAVGRPELTAHGRWMAAVLTCGEGAVLSHASAAALWGLERARALEVHVSVPASRRLGRHAIVAHRRGTLDAGDMTERDGIPLTTPIATLIDLATTLDRKRIERVINEADKLDLVDPDTLRAALDAVVPRPGVAALRAVLDEPTFALTDSELERRFLRLVRETGLPVPRTGARVAGFKVDFHWPDLGLVVETDGLRYHRTPAQQANDRRRDQALTAAGLTMLRFTHAQVAFEPSDVRGTLTQVARRSR